MDLCQPVHATSASFTDPRLQMLEGALERARRTNRPLLLCAKAHSDTPCGGNHASAPASYSFNAIDPQILLALQGQVLSPQVKIGMSIEGLRQFISSDVPGNVHIT